VIQIFKRKWNISLTLVVFLNLINLASSQSIDTVSGTGKLIVVIKGFESDEGYCRLALDNSKEIYESDDKVWIGKDLTIKNKEVIVSIDSLKYGVYAIRVYQDKNKNKKLDTNILGMPTENYGFSNDASGWFGPPSWDKAKFIFNKPEMEIQIDID
jgi:uncharacterized protein (DUF2141 family)